MKRVATDNDTRHSRSVTIAVLIAVVVVTALMFPAPSGGGSMTLSEWQDQSYFLKAVTQSEAGLPEPALRELVGPAYIAMARAVALVAGTGPAEALILLSRLTLLACAAVLMTVGLRDRAQTGVTFQILLAAVAVLSLTSSVWYFFSDIPWTHFVASALLVSMVLVSLSRASLVIRSALIGALAIMLVQTRLFEALVAGIAALVIAPLAIARHWREWRRALPSVVLPAIAGAAAGFAAIGLLSHNWSLYQQYSGQEGMVLTLELLPTKAIQLFWDPCYATVCDLVGPPGTGFFANTIDSWHQPLLLQLPGLAGAGAGLLTLLATNPRQILRLPLGIMFAVLAAGGLVVAYTSGAPSGSPHLKYGFFRDYMPALLLLATALVAALARWRAAEPNSNATLVPLVVFIIVVVGLTGLRPVGLPRLPGAEIAQIEVASTCGEGECAFDLKALDSFGRPIPYPDLAYVTCRAGTRLPAVLRVAELRVSPSECSSVTIVPIASGLLYTPGDGGFALAPLDLRLPTDTAAVPPHDPS